MTTLVRLANGVLVQHMEFGLGSLCPNMIDISDY